MVRSQTFENQSERLMMVFIEPEAQDYWLRPTEQLEIRAESTSSDSAFEIWLHEDGVVIFPSSDTGYISVWQEELELTCGHQRPNSWGNY